MAKLNKHVVGLENVKDKITTIRKRVEAAVQRGMKKAGLFLQRKSMEIVPVDTGNLRGSAFTRSTNSGFNTQVIVGYTAAYAVFVHENLDAVHGAAYNMKYSGLMQKSGLRHRNGRFASAGEIVELRGPNQQAKFLEQPARQYREEMAKIVRDEADL